VDRTAPPAGTTRIGLAVDIPEPWGSQLTECRVRAGDPQGAYVPAHITFLGPTDIPTDALPRVEKHLARVAAAHPPFTVRLSGTGTFRPITEVVFVTLAQGIGECRLLAAAIRTADGLDTPTRFPYHPHVTVAQDVAPEALDAVHADLAGFEAEFEVTGFTLFAHGGGDGPWRPRPRRDYLLGG
jgi:2'-5' RNA ligase